MHFSRDAVLFGPARPSASRLANTSARIAERCTSGKIQQYLKTANGERDVDLCIGLAVMLKDFIGSRTSGLLFCTSTGGQLLQSNTLQDSLHPILKKLEHVKGGFNIFRRFRITKLK